MFNFQSQEGFSCESRANVCVSVYYLVQQIYRVQLSTEGVSFYKDPVSLCVIFLNIRLQNVFPSDI